MSERLLLGLDASPRRIGYAISINDTILAADTTHISSTASITQRRRFWKQIRDQIRVFENEYAVDLYAIGIEQPFAGPNRKITVDHARNVGQHEALCEASFPDAFQVLIHPATWRRVLGLAPKGKSHPYSYAGELLHRQGFESWRLEQDTADAICIVSALRIIIVGLDDDV